MKERQRFEKISDTVLERIQDEVGGLIGAELTLTLRPSAIFSRSEYFESSPGKQVAALMDISGEVTGKGCLLVAVKDAIRLGGALIMLPPMELEEVIAKEEYAGETKDSYGEIANIVAGSFTKTFEDMYPRACRFVRKEQTLVHPVKIDAESDEPFPEQPYFSICAEMQLDGKKMGEMVMLVPAEPFGLAESVRPAEQQTAVPAESATALKQGSAPTAPGGADSAEDVTVADPITSTEQPGEPAQAPAAGRAKIDVVKQRKKVDTLLETCRQKIESEVGALLGIEISCDNLDNRLVSKEAFFFEEASGKQVIADLDVVGDLEDRSYLAIGLKDAIRIGGILIMLPPNELESAVSEEDFGPDSQDAYGEIANIIAGAYTAVFEEQYPQAIRFIRKAVNQVVPMKVEVAADEPMPDQAYYMSSMKLTLSGSEYGKLQLLIPAALLQLDGLARLDSEAQKPQESQQAEQQPKSAAPSAAAGGVGTIDAAAAVSAGQRPAEVLLVSDSESDARMIGTVLAERGISYQQVSFRDTFRDRLPGMFKAVFLVMNQVDEQSFGVAIKISSACSLPLIATGAGWTRSKVIKAVKYGVSDILLTPATPADIEDKINNNIMKMAA